MKKLSAGRALWSSSLLLVSCVALGTIGQGCKRSSPSSESNGTKSEPAESKPAPSGGGGAVQLGFKPSNLTFAGIDVSQAGDFVTSKNCNIKSDADENPCSLSTAYGQITQSDGTKIGVYVARTVRIEPNAVVTVLGKLPFALVALDSMEVLGGIVAGTEGAAGGPAQHETNSKGVGAGGGGAGSETNAGGGGSFCGVGGKGPLEANLTGAPGNGGTAYGTPTLVPFVVGSSGGSGYPGGGGAGGGALHLVAAKSISVAAGGYVHAGGGGGGFGGAGGTHQNGSGGGSGGAILIEAPQVTIAGALTANGGGGGSGSTQESGADGTHDDQAAKGGKAHSGNNGGNGSAGAVATGTDGIGKGESVAAGGGGGAGRIRINTQSGKADITGMISPSVATGCATQGTLAK